MAISSARVNRSLQHLQKLYTFKESYSKSRRKALISLFKLTFAVVHLSIHSRIQYSTVRILDEFAMRR